jgi:hypothetical protein
MAEEPNHLDATVGGQRVSLSTAQLPFVLTLIVGGVAGYLVWQAQDARLAVLHEQHVYLYRRFEHQDATITQHIASIRHWLETVNYNLHRPAEEQLPLDTRPSELPSPPAPPSSLVAPAPRPSP